jgi:tetratricopeptide (TPR) repeat protein
MLGTRSLAILAAATIAAMALFAYWPIFSAGYIWDDPAHVTENALLFDLHGLVRIWTETGAHQQFYPLTLTAFWIEYQLWGLNPVGYHLVNVLLQIGAALLVWRIALRLRLPGAWAAAAIFVLHPVHVESVAWVTELKNVLSGVFYLSALWFMLGAYGLYPESEPVPGGVRDKRSYALGLFLFLCAVLSKTVTSTLPAALLVLVWWRRGRLRWADVPPLLPFFAAGVGLGLITVFTEMDIGATGEAFQFTLAERFLIAGRAVWFYLGKLLWPADLLFNYTRWEIDGGKAWQYLFPASAAALLLALWLLRSRIGRGPLTAALFFCGSLFPALGFFNVYPMQFSFVADHFQYLASLGPILALSCWGAGWLRKRAPLYTTLSGAALAALLCLYTAKTWELTHYYKDSETLYRWIISKNPDSFLAQYNLGTELLLAGRVEDALPFFMETIRVKPRHLRAHINMGTALASLGAYQDAIAFFTKAQTLDPKNFSVHYDLGLAWLHLENLDAAAQAFSTAVEHNPQDAQSLFYLGYIAGRIGRYEDAAELLQQALNVKPDYADAAKLLQRALESARRASQQNAPAQ